MKTFTTIWIGQFVSLIGTGMTRFALLIWAYQQTNSATSVALLGFFIFLPPVLVGPFAGVWIDRFNRRLVMLGADLGAWLMTLALFLLFRADAMEVWHIYFFAFMAGVFETFQIPAYTALTTLIVPKESFDRVSGFRSVAEYGSQVGGPFLGAFVLAIAGIETFFLIDILTFFVAAGTLLWVRVPDLPSEINDDEEKIDETNNRYFAEFRVGFNYIRQRPGLMGLLTIFMGINFFASLTYFAILPAMILARSGNSETALAVVEGTLGLAGMLGGMAISVWGLPRTKIHGVGICCAASFLLGDFLFAIGQNLIVWVIAGAVASFLVPFISGSNQVIWQRKTDPAIQGRVFSVQRMIQMSLMPLGFLAGGLLADWWLEPAMQSANSGRLASIFGRLVGTGPGSGMAVMFLSTAVLGCGISLMVYLIPAVRHVERDLPDFEF